LLGLRWPSKATEAVPESWAAGRHTKEIRVGGDGVDALAPLGTGGGHGWWRCRCLEGTGDKEDGGHVEAR
jgi:hypothetical protein